ncbi:MaoC family dehydratase N-terminal domain-containing protein [Acidiferrimicrobium sp. IK]|nr:MaoC family dehydratase N-terminal domain-containing protein [Acidiferrimicrobium sp. IK]
MVERGKIREFAAAMQTANPAYDGEDAVAPPTFLASVALWTPEGTRPDAGFDRKRLLHGEQEYVFHGPLPRAGDHLQVEFRIGRRYEKEGRRGGTMRFAVLVTEFRDAEGNLVAEQRSTVVETAQAPKEDA